MGDHRCLRRWQSLNRSLERVTAVHDGGGPPQKQGDAAAGDYAGIALEAVTDVGDQQGWGCTQVTPITLGSFQTLA